MATTPLLETNLPGLKPFIRGKVRDVYDLDSQLLIITTDRISAYDHVLSPGIPEKGRVLTQLSAWWFQQMQNLCPNHCVTTDLDPIQRSLRTRGVRVPDRLLWGRSMLVNKTRALPVECVVRGYLDGSAWKSYLQDGTICGIALPAGLQQGSQLSEPIFTPATKSHDGHDINISAEEMAGLLDPGVMKQVVALSLAVYRAAAALAKGRGVLIADTKFEFGLLGETVVMIDECLTPDSSRFWDASGYRPGGPQPSYDKQYVRDYLDHSGWNHEPPVPVLPPEVVERTSARYQELFERITGAPLEM